MVTRSSHTPPRIAAKVTGGEITAVEPGSIGAEVGLEPGDILVAVDGEKVRDLIDYRYAIAAEEIQLKVVKPSGEEWVVDIEKDYDDGLGLSFASAVFDRLAVCRNRCRFCFVDQMPRGRRPSLYVKDDDYRLSFLQGAYVTMTNLSATDVRRIRQYRLSPLYVSVHATSDEVRAHLMGPGAAGVLDRLRQLTGAGITLHAQVVLCPGLNDGDELARTVGDLGGLWPGVASLAVVPVGLTGHRRDLPAVRPVDQDKAREVLDQLASLRAELNGSGVRDFLYASDEFYLRAGRPVPGRRFYGDFPQLANGVGLVRLFLDDVARARSQAGRRVAPADRRVDVALVTGTLFAPVLAGLAPRLEQLSGTRVTVVPVENRFLGPSVTVAGLLSGEDIRRALLAEVEAGRRPERVLLPSVTVKDGEGVFLDDLSPGDVAAATGLNVEVVPSDGRSLVQKLKEVAA